MQLRGNWVRTLGSRYEAILLLYHVPSINPNIPVGAGFSDGQLLAGIVGEPSPTKIAIARRDIILPGNLIKL